MPEERPLIKALIVISANKDKTKSNLSPHVLHLVFHMHLAYILLYLSMTDAIGVQQSFLHLKKEGSGDGKFQQGQLQYI